MSLFSFLRKNKQESASEDRAYYSRAEEDSQEVRNRSKRGTGSNRKQTSSTRRDEPVDPVLPEKKRARRRLIGAVALVLAAVIGLPMILDSEPRQLASDIAIQIPSRDEAPPIPAPVQPADQVVAETSQIQAESLAPGEEAGLPPPPPRPPPPPVAAQNTSPLKAPAPPLAKSPSPAIASSPTPSPRPVAATDPEGARALALLEGRPVPAQATAEKKIEKFVIQIAALASKEKVNELQIRLKGAGIKSYTQPVATAGGERIRVRVGPFPNRDEAEKMRARIVNMGLNGTLVPA